MNDYLKLIVASVAFSAIVIAAAQDRNAGQLHADQVTSWVEAAGYTNVRDVRRDGKHWDAKATNKDGKQVALDVDGKTGAITQASESKEEKRQDRGLRNSRGEEG